MLDRLEKIESDGKVIIGDISDKEKVLEYANGVYTDVWVSMGEPAEKWSERIELLKEY